ncbi:MAG: Hsp33 family molecular chaperone HslO [Kiritimatiellia bacterium]
MKDESTTALDPASRLSVVMVDCTSAAGVLARAHLSGPTASAVLARALAGVSLLGSECSQAEETVTFRLDCPGPLEGFLVEATAAGTLRGYTKKKVLGDFDGMGVPAEERVLGATGTFEVIRSVPGTILSSGTVATDLGGEGAISRGLDVYFEQSLQRRVRTAVAGFAGDDGVPSSARGLMVECPPDGDAAVFGRVAAFFADGRARKALEGASFVPRALLKKMGLAQAEIRRTTPLSFACRCSAERVKSVVVAIPPDERKTLPPTLDVTCHMCGRTWTVHTRDEQLG